MFVIGLLFLAVAAFGQTPATARIYTTSSILPPVGLAVTETAQVNVVNTAATSSDGTAASCTGSIAFYNAGGSIIGTATSFAVGTGQIFSVRLPYASAGASGSRTVVRVEIASAATIAGFGVPPCALASSLETYDSATGVTHAFVSGVPAQNPINVIRTGTFASTR
jgi:hypothetical protein